MFILIISINLFIVECKEKNLKFIQGVEFVLIENLPNNGTNYLLIFDDSCEEISNSKQFVRIATAGRHRRLNTIYIKHNIFHQSKLGRDRELRNTHLVLLKLPRDVLQINTSSKHLGLGYQLKEWYQDTTSVPYGHLISDLTQKTVDSLRYCSNSGSVPTQLYLPCRIETKFLDDEYTIRLYSPTTSKFFPKASKTIRSQLSKKIFVKFRVFSKPIQRRASRSSERRHSKVSRRHFRTNTKKNSSTQKKNYFKFN